MRQAIRELTQEEIEYVTNINETQRIDDMNQFEKLFNQVFGIQTKVCNCKGLNQNLLAQLTNQIKNQSDDSIDNQK